MTPKPRERQRITVQQTVILEELRNLRGHPTADEIYELVRKRLPRASLGTIYRNLERLAEEGQIRTLDCAGAPRRFDSRLEPHYHVCCSRCGRIEDVDLETTSDLDDQAASRSGYVISGHSTLFTGLCPECTIASRQRSQEEKAGQ